LRQLEIAAGIVFCAVSYVAQGKGFPYHRYPLMGLLFFAMSVAFIEALANQGWRRSLAMLGIGLQCFWIAPRAAWLVRSFNKDAPFQQALAKSLSEQDVDLRNRVQCLDTFGGVHQYLVRSQARSGDGVSL
jgi:hypothetical protein